MEQAGAQVTEFLGTRSLLSPSGWSSQFLVQYSPTWALFAWCLISSDITYSLAFFQSMMNIVSYITCTILMCKLQTFAVYAVFMSLCLMSPYSCFSQHRDFLALCFVYFIVLVNFLLSMSSNTIHPMNKTSPLSFQL